MNNLQLKGDSFDDSTLAYCPSLKNSQAANSGDIESLATSSELLASLSSFKSHGLADLDNANLMNRVDSKFLLPLSFLPEMLSLLQDNYSVLEIDNNRISRYHNQYFDTPDMSLYHDHHNGKLNRFKVRRRHYVDTDTEFLEVKLKNNKKRTIKNRIKLSIDTEEAQRCGEFINAQMQDKSENLAIRQQGGYQRIALANEAAAERLTLDFGLWFKNSKGDKKVDLPGFFIAELKQSKISKRSPFYQLMSAKNIFPTSFSKYCIGCALLFNNQIKSNQFKPILSRLEQFSQAV